VHTIPLNLILPLTKRRELVIRVTSLGPRGTRKTGHRWTPENWPTDGAAGTRYLDSRWWVPERFHDSSANTKFGKSSKTHLFFDVR
jgi:hypothetical protein